MRKYREILELRNAKLLLITSFPARVAYAMVGLALFFKVERLTDSVAFAGVADAKFKLTPGLGWLLNSRIIRMWAAK